MTGHWLLINGFFAPPIALTLKRFQKIMLVIIQNTYCMKSFRMIIQRGLGGILLAATMFSLQASAQGTRLLRQPSVSATQVAFVY